MTKQRAAAAGQTTLVVGRGQEGPNWLMLAGSAIVMALSLVIGFKQRQLQNVQARNKSVNKKNTPQPAHQIHSGSPLKPSPSSLAAGSNSRSIKTDIAMETTEEKHVRADDAHEDRTCSSVTSHLQLQSLTSKCIGNKKQSTLPLSPSPPCSPKIFGLERHGLQQYTLPARIERFQSESYTSSALCAGLSSKTGMVQKLQQQIKTQDGIIFDLQTQLTDLDQVIAIYHAHILDLHERLDVTQKENMDPNCEACRSCHAESRVRPPMRSENSGKEDIDALIAEARKLKELVKSLKEENMEQDIANQAMNMQHQSLVEKVVKMETELKEAKMLATQKQQLIKKYECECFNYQIALEKLQHRLDAETMDNEFLRTTKVIGLTDTSSANMTWKWSEILEPSESTNTHDEDVSSKCCTVIDNGDSSHHRGGNVMRSYNVLFSSNSHPLGGNNISSSRGGSRSTTHGATASKDTPLMGISDSEYTDDANNGTISENLLAALQQEVEQVATALATHRKVVSEKREETSCVVSEFQKQSAVNTDVHEAESSGAQDWTDFSYSSGDMSAAQVQELSHKLEQIAKKHRVDEDLMELIKHQVKIAKLKRQVSKLTSKCHVLSNTHSSSPDEEGTCDQHDPGVNSVVFDLAEKLAEQEEQAKQMSMEVQRLSASFQLSSPYVPKSKKEELRKLFQGDDDMQPGHCESGNKFNQRTKSSDPRSAKPRYTVFKEEELEENCSGFQDSLFSLTSLKGVDAGDRRNEDVELWSPMMKSSKLGRTLFSNGVKNSRSSQNLPPVYDGGESNLQQDVSEFSKCNSLFKSRHHQPIHIKLSPEEVTGRFSFRTARDRTTPDVAVNSGSDENMNFRALSTFDKDISVASDPPEVTSNVHDCLSVSKPSCCVQGEGGSCPLRSQDTAVIQFDDVGGMEAEIRRLQREIEQVMLETSAVADINSPKPGPNFVPNCKENLSPLFSAKYTPYFTEKLSPLSDNNSSLALPRKKTTRLTFSEQKSSRALTERSSPTSDEQFRSSVTKESQMSFGTSTDQKSSSILSERTIPMSHMLLGGKNSVDSLDGSVSSSSMATLLAERSASSSPAFNDQLSPAFDSKTSPTVQVGSPTISGSITPRFFGWSEAADGTSLRRSLFKSNRNSLSGDSATTPCLYGNNDDDDKTSELRRLDA